MVAVNRLIMEVDFVLLLRRVLDRFRTFQDYDNLRRATLTNCFKGVLELVLQALQPVNSQLDVLQNSSPLQLVSSVCLNWVKSQLLA